MVLYSPQSSAVQGGGGRRRQRTPYLDWINSQYGLATQSVVDRKQKELTQKMHQDEMDIANRDLNQQADQARVNNAMSLASLGMNFGNQMGDKTVGGLFGGKGPSWMNKFNLGGAVGGAGLGYGLANMFNKNPSSTETALYTIGGGIAGGLLGGLL